MTLERLNNLKYLKAEIDALSETLIEIKRQYPEVKVTSSISARTSNYKDSKQERRVFRKEKLEKKIEAMKHRLICEYNEIIEYISGIEDSLTRTVFILRFVNGKSWNRVADKVGGMNSDYSVKKMCYRYIEKNFRGNENERDKDTVQALHK